MNDDLFVNIITIIVGFFVLTSIFFPEMYYSFEKRFNKPDEPEKPIVRKGILYPVLVAVVVLIIVGIYGVFSE